MEWRLARLHYHRDVLDTKERWIHERARASRLGKRALILVGRSRFQLGLDLDVLRKDSGLEPVQLAVDGASVIPVLKGLVDDPAVSGTIMVDYYPGDVDGNKFAGDGRGGLWEMEYERLAKLGNPDISLAAVEKKLSEAVYENLASYADGTTPLMSLRWRVLSEGLAPQYVTMAPDRSKMADYRRVRMPDRYYGIVAAELSKATGARLEAPNSEKYLEERIKSLSPLNNADFIRGSISIKHMKMALENRGGKMIFVKMPMSGMILEMNDRLFPKEDFQNVFEREVGGLIYSSDDDPELKEFVCPEGSHLDFRDRANFTRALDRLIAMRDWTAAGAGSRP